MKEIVIAVLLCFSAHVSAQLSGDLITSGRKCLTDTDFTILASKTGVVKYILSVDNTGKVVSATLMKSESTVSSTPSLIKSRNYVSNLTFEPGTKYPKYHEVKVLLHLRKE